MKRVLYTIIDPWFGIIQTIRGKLLFLIGLMLVTLSLLPIITRDIAPLWGLMAFGIIVFGGWIFYIEKNHRERIEWRELVASKREASKQLKQEQERQEKWDRERPDRLEQELADIKRQLARMNSQKSSPRPPPRQQHPPNFTGKITTENQALEVFDMKKPYTAQDVKKRRAQLLQQIHPDKGGSGMMVRLVNDAYEILIKKV